MKLTILAAALLAAAACAAAAGGPPEITLDRTACSHCGMLISESLYAAAYQAPGADARVFDDIGCLRDAARKEGSAGLRFWFHDATHGGWIEGTEAVFVASPEIRTPMGGGLIAHGDPAAAERSAAQTHGRVIRSISDLLSKEDGS
jgi:nitrous oxide reductase accessory protein NosL